MQCALLELLMQPKGLCKAWCHEVSTDAVTAARQSAILGFGVFQVLERYGFRKLSVGENVILQTTSVATATMPLAAGMQFIQYIILRIVQHFTELVGLLTDIIATYSKMTS